MTVCIILGATDLHMVLLMPLPPIIFYFIQIQIGFYRASYASAVLGVVILSVRLSVRPSVCPFVTHMLCD